jgi:hypothetical protein
MAVFCVVGPQGIGLMMEAANTSETSVNFCQTKRRNNPEDSRLHRTILFDLMELHAFLLCFWKFWNVEGEG